MPLRDRNKSTLRRDIIRSGFTTFGSVQKRSFAPKQVAAELRDMRSENDRLRSELKMLREEALYHRHAYQSTSQGLITFSRDGSLLDLNQTACECLGIAAEVFENHDFREFLKVGSETVFSQHLAACKDAQGAVINVLSVVNSCGDMVDISFESIPWKSDETDASYILSLVKGVDDREQARPNEMKLLAMANLCKGLKREVIAQIGHGLRTPLGVMIGFTDLMLERHDIDDDITQGLSIIHRNGFGLLSLIDDLVDLAKLEAGSMEMETSEFIIEAEVLSILAEHNATARLKDVALKYEALTPLPSKILTDPLRFRQILNSIIGNALKFTDRGHVRVQLSMVPKTLQEDPGSYLHVDVIDTGCGISSDQFTQVFQPFSSGDGSENRPLTGTGLGLSLARRLGESLGGGVQLLRSEVGLGSTFRITIDPHVEINAIRGGDGQSEEKDREFTKDETPLLVDLGALEGLRVLVVEDGEDNRLILSRLLKKAGALVECVENGEEAIRAVDKHPYDAILMDIQMPHMDGYTVTTRLRMKGCKIPIIALTAHTQIEDRVRAQRAGFDDFLSKPIDRQKLVNTLASYQGESMKPAL